MAAPLGIGCWLSSRCVLPDQESRLKLLIRVSALGSREGRSGLNVCLAIDRSFSMQEDHKLERAREAACAFIDSLAPTDTISLVDFGTDVHVAQEAQSGVNKDALKRAVMQIRAHSATNLHGALHAAGAAVARAFNPDRINRVILLSDGVATEGITSDEEILKVARTARGMGISVTTIGLGQDYDEVLLSGISEATRGNHYFVERPAEIPGIFARELSRIESVVARGVRLHLKSSEDLRVRLVNGRYRDRCEMRPGEVTVELDDMERKGVQPLLFELAVPPHTAGEITLADVSVDYQQPGSGSSGGEPPPVSSARVRLLITPDVAQVRAGINRDVLRYWEELDSIQAVATAVERNRAGGLTTQEVLGIVQNKTRLLERTGSPRAAALSRLGRTIVDQGGITSEVAKRTIVERVRAQQGLE